MWGRGWLKTSYGRRGLAENDKIPSYRGGVLKLLKNRHMIFERSLIWWSLDTHLFVKVPRPGDSEGTFTVIESSCYLLLPV